MTTRQLFDFVTSDSIEDTPEAESAAIDVIIAHVEDAVATSKGFTDEQLKRHADEQRVEEAVFMSQFLPRSLSQVAERDAGRIAGGGAEGAYTEAVSALTGDGGSGSRHTAFTSDGGSEGKVYGDVVIDEQGARLADRVTSEGETSDDGIPTEEGEATEDDVDSDVGGDRFVKVAMTPEEAAAARDAARAARKANKKAVKEAQSERRRNKIKKKDKQRAINKTKGNKKKK